MTERQPPEMLDPDRVLTDKREALGAAARRSRTEQLSAALHDSCDYARKLWDQLESVRQYLVDSLPAPVAPGEELGAAHPDGAGDEKGWTAWTDTYAAVTSALAGPHGDGGFGRTEARQHVRARLEFSRGRRPTAETIEGIERAAPTDAAVEVTPAPPRRHDPGWEIGALVAGLALGWAAHGRPAPRRA